MPMRLAIVASILMTSLALNAKTIQGKVVGVGDGWEHDHDSQWDEGEAGWVVDRRKSNSDLGV